MLPKFFVASTIIFYKYTFLKIKEVKIFLWLSAVFFLFYQTLLCAQNNSYKAELLKKHATQNTKSDKHLTSLYKLSVIFNETNPDSSLFYSNLALKHSSQNHPLFPDIYIQKGISFKIKGLADSANYYFFKSLQIYKNRTDIDNIINANILLGEFLRSTHTLRKAVPYIREAIALSVQNKVYKFLPYSYNRLAAIYYEVSFNKNTNNGFFQDTLNLSIKYVDSSFYWSKKMNVKNYDGSNYNILGAYYFILNKYDMANLYMYKALQDADENGEIIEKPMIYHNISRNYFQTKQYLKAIDAAKQGAKIADSLGVLSGLHFNYYSLSLV
ncbi:MAG: hypothetical protein HY738_05730 [Bacteroidia bacterium]|nr:hypothetical protein [Bacteroidia bacterium]